MELARGLVMLGPARCAGCGARAGWLCPSCAASAVAAPSPFGLPGLDLAVAPWSYRGGPRALILALKLRGLRTAARPLVAAMAAECRRAGVTATAVTWVPARPADRRRRGFDHAEVLARGVASVLGLPAVHALARRGTQADQAGLDRLARAANVGGAFVGSRRLEGPVLLVDDLVTTGATAAACAAALRAAGAPAVELVVGCRA